MPTTLTAGIPDLAGLHLLPSTLVPPSLLPPLPYRCICVFNGLLQLVVGQFGVPVKSVVVKEAAAAGGGAGAAGCLETNGLNLAAKAGDQIG